ncbi:type II toxin-antitoxin system HicB family antitoxin [Halobellus sp. GM3]|uniref:type II toxin-antitoxin system HicB family antitoxin n=1 Tax=Halobellus sp. GM3 TaxID=3458410 RepID=UPI00403DB1B9
MSTDSGTDSARTPSITLTKNPDGKWTARDLEAEISAQGETRQGALENLDAVVDAVRGQGGREPTDEELRELGIDPEQNTLGGELPDVLE